MTSRPPLVKVPILAARCPWCDARFKGAVSWKPDAPLWTRNRCPRCGRTVMLDRDGHPPPRPQGDTS